EPPYEPRVQPTIYSQPVKPAADPIKEIARVRIEVIGKSGSFPGNALVGFVFRVEDTQRVTFEPPAAVLRQFGDPRRKVADERLAVGGATFVVAQCVELEDEVRTKAECVENAAAQRDNLDVGLRLGHADQLDPDLVELAEPAFLRPLIAEHRAAVEEFEWHAL